MDWKKYISRKGEPLPSAFSRVSEFLGVHFNTVKAWFYGGDVNEYWQRRLQDVVHSRLQIVRKTRRDIGKKRKNLTAQSVHKSTTYKESAK